MADLFDPIADLHNALLKEDACLAHGEITRSTNAEHADYTWDAIQACAPAKRIEHLRWLALNDLYFLVTKLCNNYVIAGHWELDGPRDPLAAKWFFDRCQEVQDDPDGYCDQWSRGAGKSSIITFGKTIQDILANPEVTICILSHVRPIAKNFLIQIKVEFEKNELLKEIFPDVLWADPQREAQRWSENDGIIVKRKGNLREATVEAYGLVDGMPTGLHFYRLVYDDVVTEKSVTTPDQVDKATKAMELSVNLAASRPIRFRMIGTPYAEGDTYQIMMERGFAKPRIRPAIVGDKSYLWDEAGVAQLKQTMSRRMFALQILMDAKQAEKERGFKTEWVHHWKVLPSLKALNKYIFVDPAGDGPESNSFTAMVVVGLGADRHAYILDMIKDRIGLVRKGELLFELHKKYEPLNVFYERYSMQGDIAHIRDRMERENYRFNLTEVGASGGLQLSKDRRIEKLQPLFADGLLLLPPLGRIKYLNYEGQTLDLVENFIKKEMMPFPYTNEKDLLDALSRLKDPAVLLNYPKRYGTKDTGTPWGQGASGAGTWMGD
jgi:hypothetical protein